MISSCSFWSPADICRHVYTRTLYAKNTLVIPKVHRFHGLITRLTIRDYCLTTRFNNSQYSISSNRQKHHITNESIVVVISSTLYPYIHLQKSLPNFMSLSTVMSHLSFVFKRKTDPKMPSNILLPKCFSKKTMSQVLLLSASPLSNKKTLVDIYPQNHKKSVLKQSYIQSSSCGKYDSNVFFRFTTFWRITIFCWVIRKQKQNRSKTSLHPWKTNMSP